MNCFKWQSRHLPMGLEQQWCTSSRSLYPYIFNYILNHMEIIFKDLLFLSCFQTLWSHIKNTRLSSKTNGTNTLLHPSGCMTCWLLFSVLAAGTKNKTVKTVIFLHWTLIKVRWLTTTHKHKSKTCRQTYSVWLIWISRENKMRPDVWLF